MSEEHFEPHPILSRPQRRDRFITSNEITLVLDVGGWTGAYGAQLRSGGYRGRIVSFEPLTASFEQLHASARADDAPWDTHQVALGSRTETATLGVSRESSCSSLLPMKPRQLDAAPEAALKGEETVRVARLDEMWPDIVPDGANTYLKIDVQGFELEVLEGAGRYVNHIAVLELEISLVPLYEGGPLLNDILGYLNPRGFRLASIEALLDDMTTGEMLQVDGIFVRA